MRFVAIIIVLAAFPAFLALLNSPQYRRWAFVALGAMPILYVPLNLDASFISWPVWQGHTKGLLLTILDPIALAICIRYGRGHPTPWLLWAFVIYILCLLPGLFAGYFTPASFFVFQALRITLYFYAVYVAVLSGQALRIAEGMAYAVIVSGLVSTYHALSGAIQAKGILGHQNLTGLSINLGMPILLSLALSTKRSVFLLAIAAGAVGAVAGGSRATIVFFALSVAGTLLVTILIKPTGRTLAIAGVAALGLVATAPFAIEKLGERSTTGFEKDAERVAFERTAELMIEDYPWGVGLNQYVSVANGGGYFNKAGVRWGSEARSTNVHNAYLLMRAEAGLLGLLGLLVWLLSPICLAIFLLFRKKSALREVSFASGLAVVAVALHSQYEWALFIATPQYLVSLMAGFIAAISAYSARAKHANGPEVPRKLDAEDRGKLAPIPALPNQRND
jgi:O-antigen ligase